MSEKLCVAKETIVHSNHGVISTNQPFLLAFFKILNLGSDVNAKICALLHLVWIFPCGCYATLFPWQHRASRMWTISKIDRDLKGYYHGKWHSFIRI